MTAAAMLPTARTTREPPARAIACRLLVLAFTAVRAGEPSAVPCGKPVVEVEEVVTSFAPPRNGAGPLWCYGAPLVVRRAGEVFVSAAETGEDVPPLSNTRWRILRRKDGAAGAQGAAWALVAGAGRFREREPCPIVRLHGRLFVSTNPSIAPEGTRYGPTRPAVVAIDIGGGSEPRPSEETPVFAAGDGAAFTDHSYRGFAADPERGELLLLHIDAKTGVQRVSWRDAGGRWHGRGAIEFPIRAAYPQVALRDGAAHVLAIGDIVEPNEEWRRLKKETTGREWDYVFRRLFWTWTPDVARGSFREPVEVATVEATAGHISNLDLHAERGGRARLLWIERPYQDSVIRERFFPGAEPLGRLRLATVDGGAMVSTRTLIEESAGEAGLGLVWARLHETPDAGLVLVLGARVRDGKRAPRHGIFLRRIDETGDGGGAPLGLDDLHEIRLEKPLHRFFVATTRGGSRPSWTLDLFGTAGDAELRYARVRLPVVAHVLSESGSGRATGYAEASKIVTHEGRTHVAWLDSRDGRFLVRSRTLDRRSGEWSEAATIGEAHDNHGGPALTIDREGHLWAAYGPHHHPLRVARSVRPNDATAWVDTGTVGERATYPTLVRGPDGALLLSYRASRDGAPWEVRLARKPPGGAWEDLGPILRAGEPGYAHFQEALAWSPGGGTLHLSCRLYGGGGGRRGHTVGYLRSADGGRAWTRADGTAVELPATAATVDAVARAPEGAGVGLRSGAVAAGPRGRPWVLWSSFDEVPPRAFVATPDGEGGWRRRPLEIELPPPLEGYGLALPGALAFERDGAVTIALTTLRPESGGESTWGHPTSEVVLLCGRRGPEGPLRVRVVSMPDPAVPHWLPALERPTAPELLARPPAVLWTEGPRGESNRAMMANRVMGAVPE